MQCLISLNIIWLAEDILYLSCSIDPPLFSFCLVAGLVMQRFTVVFYINIVFFNWLQLLISFFFLNSWEFLLFLMLDIALSKVNLAYWYTFTLLLSLSSHYYNIYVSRFYSDWDLLLDIIHCRYFILTIKVVGIFEMFSDRQLNGMFIISSFLIFLPYFCSAYSLITALR